MSTYVDVDAPPSPRIKRYKPAVAGIRHDDIDPLGDLAFDPTPEYPANVVTSLCEDGMHRPVLDLDMRAVLVASSTPGHYHLFLPDVALEWPEYERLLDALADARILDRSYVAHAKRRRETAVRIPGTRKPKGATNS